MFIKITKSGKYKYAQLVKSYRKDGETKHKVMLNLGRLDYIENNPSFQNLGRRLLEISKAEKAVNIDNISEAEIMNYGYMIYKRLFEKFGLSEILDNVEKRLKIKYSLKDAVFLMMIYHLLSPRSKLSGYKHQGDFVKLPEVELQYLYRALDVLNEYKEEFEERIFVRNRHLFNMQVDVVFYDVTTFSFESVKRDSLREFGYSKDGKFKEVQVVMGLLIDCEGRPIGYELFPGNTFEGETLVKALEKLEKRFGIRKVVIVADRGINNKINLKRIVEKGYKYIVAKRIKRMEKGITEEMFKQSGYQEIMDGEESIRYKIIDYVNEIRIKGEGVYGIKEKLIITYSEKRAEKDRADRERLIEKARKLLEEPSRIKANYKRGGRKYIKELNRVEWSLDEKAIERDSRYDGYYGIETNEEDISPRKILEAYHGLWKIEESFRIMKSNMEVRPIYHWTESRIKGHFVVSFFAFLMLRTLEYKLKRAGIKSSPDKIREAINSMNFAKIKIEGRDYLVKTKSKDLANKIIRALRIKPMKNVVSYDELKI